MDIYGPSRISSIGCKKYALVIIDDNWRFIWIMFVSHKNKDFSNFKVFCRKVQREAGYFISTIHRDYGGEVFVKVFFKLFHKKRSFCPNNSRDWKTFSPWFFLQIFQRALWSQIESQSLGWETKFLLLQNEFQSEKIDSNLFI